MPDLAPDEVTAATAYNELSNYFDRWSDTISDEVRDYVCAQWMNEHILEPNKKGDKREYNRNLILEAVRYVAWCNAGLIDNSDHKATVRNYFGLNDTGLVDDWCKRYDTGEPPEQTSKTAVDLVRVGIQIAGEHYQRKK